MKSRSASEKISFIPRSILRTLGKFKQTFDPEAESKVVEEFRASRYRTITSTRYLLILILVPLLVNQLSKIFVISPLIEKFWAKEQLRIFLNSFQEERALTELRTFEHQINFEVLIGKAPKLLPEIVEKKLKKKTILLTQEYRNKSINAVANIFVDILSVATFIILVVTGRQQMAILRYFTDKLVYGLSDSAKAFLIILSTNIFVEFHSSYGWEVILESTLRHFGLPENQNFISLFIATFPVILDSIFKYWIFRYLNRASPSAVATYHNMND